MPGIDGYETTRRIRAPGLGRAKDISIVAITANTFRVGVKKCNEMLVKLWLLLID